MRRSRAWTKRRSRNLPGFIKVVVRKNFVGVVAEKPWQAIRAAAALKATWTAGSGLPRQADFYDYLRTQPSRDTLVVDSQDVDDTRSRAATIVKATYRHPYQMHGSMGSSCAVADVAGRSDHRVVVHAIGLSDAQRRRDAARCARGTGARRVHQGLGCYGINGADTVSYDAALLSHGVGRPVRVQLSRKDEMAWENYGFAYVDRPARRRSMRRAPSSRGTTSRGRHRSADVPATTRRAMS